MERTTAMVGFAMMIASSCGSTAGPPASSTSDPQPSASPAAPGEDGRDRSAPELLLTCTSITPTHKRHASYVFHFRVDAVLHGEFAERTFTTGELFAGSGGSALMAKLGAETSDWTTWRCAHRIVAKLMPASADATAGWHLLWVAREGEQEAFRGAERPALALIEAIERDDYERVRLHLEPPSVMTAERFEEIVRQQRARGDWAEFRSLIQFGLQDASNGELWLGRSAGDYSFALTRGAAGRWQITALAARATNP